jgi:cytolysin-activating lysine-acyltransferase
VSGAPAAGTPQPELSEEQKRKNAMSSKMVVAAFGEIVSLLMRTQTHRNTMLSDLEWLVAPAVASGQFTVAEAQSKANGITQPMGVVLWARVSPDIDQRLHQNVDQPLKLAPQEWVSGDIVWIVEAAGEPRVVEAMLKRLAESAWKDKTVRVRGRDKDGKPAIGVFSAAPPPPAA